LLRLAGGYAQDGSVMLRIHRVIDRVMAPRSDFI
jgi:hypothetical protein